MQVNKRAQTEKEESQNIPICRGYESKQEQGLNRKWQILQAEISASQDRVHQKQDTVFCRMSQSPEKEHRQHEDTGWDQRKSWASQKKAPQMPLPMVWAAGHFLSLYQQMTQGLFCGNVSAWRRKPAAPKGPALNTESLDTKMHTNSSYGPHRELQAPLL